jgi:hypothetical protein
MWWLFLSATLTGVFAGPAGAQDVSFLQPVLDALVERTEEYRGETFQPRFIDASSIQRAHAAARLRVPSVSEVREALARPDSDQVVVDSAGAVIEQGSRNDPRFLAIRAGRTGPVTAWDEIPSERTRWVRDDGLIFVVREVIPTGEGYLVSAYAAVTTPSHYGHEIGVYGDTVRFSVIRRGDEWVVR